MENDPLSGDDDDNEDQSGESDIPPLDLFHQDYVEITLNQNPVQLPAQEPIIVVSTVRYKLKPVYRVHGLSASV